MDFDHRKADLLCRRYLDATASEAETDSLRRMLCDAPHDVLTPQMRLCATMLRGFEALRTERMPERPRRRALRLRLAAAIGIAACLAGKLNVERESNVCFLLTGGNVDQTRLFELLGRGCQ